MKKNEFKQLLETLGTYFYYFVHQFSPKLFEPFFDLDFYHLFYLKLWEAQDIQLK